MTTASSATSRPNFERRRSTNGDPERRRRPFGDGVSALVRLRRHCPATRQTGAGSSGSRTWSRRSASSTSATTARSARRRRSGLSAVARTAIFKTSNGAASSIRTSAGEETDAAEGRRLPETDVAGGFGHQRRPTRHAHRLRMRGVPVAGRAVSARPPRRMLRRTALDRFERSRSEPAATRALRLADPQRDEHLFPAGRARHLAAASGRRSARNLEAVWTDISECKTVDDVKQAKKFNSVVSANLQGYSDEEILARILIDVRQRRTRRRGRRPEDRRISTARERASADWRQQP